jgi:hypothetical protein
MQRIWRSKPTPELISIMEESVDIRLYLIQEKGPLSFVFQDDDKKKYNINIGDGVHCSCGGGKKEHCIHSIYVLNRIFKIQFNDPLIFQLSYSDSEVTKILNSRKADTAGEKGKKKKNDENFGGDNTVQEGNRMNLHDDITCAICQEDMYAFQVLYYCTNSCGHNFHTHCLKVWSEHKRSVSDVISCPMCRSVWPDEEFKTAILAKRNKNYIHIKSHKVNCKSCERTNIKGERFHCLQCDNHDMCIECFVLGKHNQHPLIFKKSVDDKWLGMDLINSTDRYNLKHMRLSQYLISLLADYDDSRNNVYEKSCFVCKSDRASSLHLLKLKELPVCKHLIHFKCCENVFKLTDSKNGYIVDMGFNKCRYDGVEIFIGLKSLNFQIAEKPQIEKTQTETTRDGKTIYTAPDGLFIRKYGKNKVIHNNRIMTHPRKLISPMSRPLYGRGANFDLALNIEKLDFHIGSNIHGYEKEVKNEIKTKVHKARVINKLIPKKLSENLPPIEIKGIGFKQLTLKVKTSNI